MIDCRKKFKRGFISANFFDVFFHHRTIFHHIEGWAKTCFSGFIVERVDAKAVFVFEELEVMAVKRGPIADNEAALSLKAVVELRQLIAIRVRSVGIDFAIGVVG